MNPNQIDAEFVAHAARGIDLELAPEHMPGVVRYFQLIVGMAATLNEFALDDTAEHAAIFTPCSPPARD